MQCFRRRTVTADCSMPDDGLKVHVININIAEHYRLLLLLYSTSTVASPFLDPACHSMDILMHAEPGHPRAETAKMPTAVLPAHERGRNGSIRVAPAIARGAAYDGTRPGRRESSMNATTCNALHRCTQGCWIDRVHGSRRT